MEAIILAGGLGTRLRSEVKDVPKPMASINSRPFMEYLLDHMIGEGVNRVIFSVGHKANIIEDHFGNAYHNCEIVYAKEETRLGTGGAIKNAMQYVLGQDVIIGNGDSIFKANLKTQVEQHRKTGADVTMTLKPMLDFDRYGTVDLDENGRIVQFNEKRPTKEGLINTGTYIFKVGAFRSLDFPEKFSIEKEFFETHLTKMKFVGSSSNGYFLDIGIPTDFKKAQYEIGIFPNLNQDWTLFLAAKAFMNAEMKANPRACLAIANLSRIFGRLILTTPKQEDTKSAFDTFEGQLKHERASFETVYYDAELSNIDSTNNETLQRVKADYTELDFSKCLLITDLEDKVRVMMTDDHIEKQSIYTVKELTAFYEILRGILT